MICLHTINSYSNYDCSSLNAWEITNKDNSEAMNQFQNWIFARQNNLKFCDKKENRKLDYKYGLGASFTVSLNLLIESLEVGYIYNPNYPWLWASIDSNECTNHVNSIVSHFY